MNDPTTLVNKLWSYCNVLRDDGLSYGDYLEQLTYLLFLKMAHEYTQAPWKRPSPVPEGFDWPALVAKDGAALEVHYQPPSSTSASSTDSWGWSSASPRTGSRTRPSSAG